MSTPPILPPLPTVLLSAALRTRGEPWSMPWSTLVRTRQDGGSSPTRTVGLDLHPTEPRAEATISSEHATPHQRVAHPHRMPAPASLRGSSPAWGNVTRSSEECIQIWRARSAPTCIRHHVGRPTPRVSYLRRVRGTGRARHHERDQSECRHDEDSSHIEFDVRRARSVPGAPRLRAACARHTPVRQICAAVGRCHGLLFRRAATPSLRPINRLVR
jgi:hypothetical protein